MKSVGRSPSRKRSSLLLRVTRYLSAVCPTQLHQRRKIAAWRA